MARPSRRIDFCTVSTTLDFCGFPAAGRARAKSPRKPGKRKDAAAGGEVAAAQPHTIRRWEAAESHRLNKAHWQNAKSLPINTELLADLEYLRTRATYEAANNGIVEGVINTHAEDVVGDDGPTLQVLSDSPAYNTAAERAWQDWFSAPCPNPKWSGVQLLKLWVRGLWLNGEYLAQVVTARAATGPVALRMRPIHPRRLATPMEFAGDQNVFMGIRFDADGVPANYYVLNSQPANAQTSVLAWDYATLPAAVIAHEFLVREEDQYRGYPWLACGLQPAADIRDYDADVLDAARQAAANGVVWYTDTPDAAYIEVNESIEMERGTERTGPPGYKPMQINPTQPASAYVDYRRERQAEIGRPASMPLMTIRLDSSKHNYSSARFDGQNYHRAVKGIQTWLSGSPKSYGCLSWLFGQVAAEARFDDVALRNPPPRVRLRWLWPVPPHVDPTKEGQAERIGLEDGTLPFSVATAARGFDEEAVFDAEQRTNQLRADRGLPPLPAPGAYLSKAGAGVTDQVNPRDAQQTAEEIDDAQPDE